MIQTYITSLPAWIEHPPRMWGRQRLLQSAWHLESARLCGRSVCFETGEVHGHITPPALLLRQAYEAAYPVTNTGEMGDKSVFADLTWSKSMEELLQTTEKRIILVKTSPLDCVSVVILRRFAKKTVFKFLILQNVLKKLVFSNPINKYSLHIRWLCLMKSCWS